MERYADALGKSGLFDGIAEDEMNPLLTCLDARVSHYGKNRTVLPCGARAARFGIALTGRLQITCDDCDGRRHIVSSVGPGDLFGEAFVLAHAEFFPFDVLSVTECDVLLIDGQLLASPCSRACAFHTRLVRNMLGIVSEKNTALTRKLEYVSRRTTREKLLAYLSGEARRAGSRQFDIPFNRQALADYLNVERSAMSAELSKLRRDGMLTCRRSRFELL